VTSLKLPDQFILKVIIFVVKILKLMLVAFSRYIVDTIIVSSELVLAFYVEVVTIRVIECYIMS
jgi:hypothetical protein